MEKEKVEVLNILNKQNDDANFLTDQESRRLKGVVRRRIKAFGLYSSQCKMSKLSSMEPEITEGIEHLAAERRRFTNEQTDWLRNKIEELLKLGIIEETMNPLFGQNKWRMVVNMCALNNISKKTALQL